MTLNRCRVFKDTPMAPKNPKNRKKAIRETAILLKIDKFKSFNFIKANAEHIREKTGL